MVLAGIPIAPELDTLLHYHLLAVFDDFLRLIPFDWILAYHCYYHTSTLALTGRPAKNGGPLPALNEPDDQTEAGDGSESL